MVPVSTVHDNGLPSITKFAYSCMQEKVNITHASRRSQYIAISLDPKKSSCYKLTSQYIAIRLDPKKLLLSHKLLKCALQSSAGMET